MRPAARRAVVLAAITTLLAPVPVVLANGLSLELRDGWTIESSAKVSATGEALSMPGFDAHDWHRASVPTTVVSALVADGTFPDPYVGMNLRGIPGTTYAIGDNFSVLPMPESSPFRVPWWYRTEFDLPVEAREHTLWLRLDGVNYRFDAWLNGTKIADRDRMAGAFRVHELNVTGIAKPGRNALAILVEAPQSGDLAITFVDWRRTNCAPVPPV